MPQSYHLRLMENAMPGWADQLAVIRGQQFVTLAMCKDNQPYMVALNYVFIEEEKSFYVHCAAAGRKIDYLTANPRVWGMIVENNGYIAGKCSHAYRTVMFSGVIEKVTAPADKAAALAKLIECYEPDPEPCKARLLKTGAIERTNVLRIRVEEFSGKQSPPPA